MNLRVVIRNFVVFCFFTISSRTCGVLSFQASRRLSHRASRSIPLFGEKSSSSDYQKDQQEEDFLFGGEIDSNSVRNSLSDDQLFSSLNRKIKQLELGIGKRYVIRTQRGFLNVHYEPSDPYMSQNVVNQLSDGDIVTATGPRRGIWIPHDGGGWSVYKYGGFTWLEPIDE